MKNWEDYHHLGELEKKMNAIALNVFCVITVKSNIIINSKE